MKLYAHVTFAKPGDRGGAEQQKMFTEQMREAGIILITDDAIAQYFERDKKCPAGSTMHIVLHSVRETKELHRILEGPEYRFEEVTYRITLTPKNKKFDRWLTEHKRKTALKNSGYNAG